MYDLAKEAWLKALRSGEFTQGKNRLAASNLKNGAVEYCCLGVLCEVAVRNGANVTKASKDGHEVSYDNRSQWLPNSIANWAGLEDGDPIVSTDDGRLTPLSYLNDIEEMSFEEIARLVEEQL